MKGLKIQIDKGVDGVVNFFTSNTKEDFNNILLLKSHNVEADKIARFELSDEDTRYINNVGCREMNPNLIGVEQCFMDYSISGKIQHIKRSYTRAYKEDDAMQYPTTEVLTVVDTVLRDMVGELVTEES